MSRPSPLTDDAAAARSELTTRPTALTPAQWLSLHESWKSASPAPGPVTPGGRRGGRPSTHGHPGATAIPRWGQ
jgi:hypothetical protein